MHVPDRVQMKASNIAETAERKISTELCAYGGRRI